MFLRMHAATFLRYRLRLSRIRCVNVIGWLLGEITWPSKSKAQKVFLHAFLNAGIFSRSFSCILQCWDSHSTRYHVYYFTTYFYICLIGYRTWQLGKVCSWELPYLVITSSAQKTQRDFYGFPSSQAQGLDSAKLLDAASHEDWRQEKFHTMSHDIWILNSKSWNLGSRLGGLLDMCHRRLIFWILERQGPENKLIWPSVWLYDST